MSIAIDKSNNQERVLEFALKEDWTTMLSSLERKLATAMTAPSAKRNSFELVDTVGIYSSDQKFEIETRFGVGDKTFQLTYYVRPLVVYPGRLVRGLCDVPRSYSEINQALVQVLLRALTQYRSVPYMGWGLKTIVGGTVRPDRNYSMCLQFERR